MSDSESIKKMLRSVLQSSKTGVSITRLQSEYQSLCGESIPLKKLGFSKLEDYLRSIPSVVRLENHMGELKCLAAVCEETAHIAELVAKQKSSKKSGRSQVVNCKMRFKPSNPCMVNVRPRSSLRQPSAGGALNWSSNRSRPSRGFNDLGEYRKEKSLANVQKPHRERQPERASRPTLFQSSVYDVELAQSRVTQILQKYCSGLWMSKLSGVYSEMFSQQLHPQVLVDLEKWTQVCMVEQPSSNNRVDRLIYPPLPLKPSIVPRRNTNISPPASPPDSTIITPFSSGPTSQRLSTTLPSSPVLKPRVSSKKPLPKATFMFPQQPTASLVQPLSLVTPCPAHTPALSPCVSIAVNVSGACKVNPNLTTATINHNQNSQSVGPTWTYPVSSNAAAVASSLQSGPDILPLLKVTIASTSESAPQSKANVDMSAEVRQRIKELLSKCSHGLWAHAVPKLFIDTYKMPFPEHVLDNLSFFLDLWSVEYPIPHDKKKAILYSTSRTDMEPTDSKESHPLPSGLQVIGTDVPPRLLLPIEQYPSVLITDAKTSNAVTVRYVGENYSNAQEAMEDAMRLFYSQSSFHHSLPNPVVGQLVAVRGEDGDELARAQVLEVMAPNKVKVYYVDYGFSVETSGTSLLELHQDFLSLPFQATNVRLAGLEAFSSHTLVVSCLNQLAVGKILLMETLEPCQQNETPLAVLYDTSQDRDVNINSACLKALQDKSMNNPLTVNVIYRDVCVTNVCAEGIIYCQLPSRGRARLSRLLEKTEAFFISQMTSESLVSRPFCGKICLASYKGKWSRVEITNMYGNKVMEILFIDLGVPATVEITDLREMPPVFLKDFAVIPPQAIKCVLAELPIPEGDWSPHAVCWLKQTVLGLEDCKMKILKLDECKGERLVYMYLFNGADTLELDKSINHQLAQSELWQKLTTQSNNTTITCANSSEDTGLSALVEKLTLGSLFQNPIVKATDQPYLQDTMPNTEVLPLPLPPPLELPQPGQNMDVFVPVACHPGYFVLQLWQDLHKLVVLMGEMVLYYNQACNTRTATKIKKGEVYAAKIDKKWNRVQVNGILAKDLVSVYELDYGKYELVHSSLIAPLIEQFRQLPFQAIAAQLAGVTLHQWSEKACVLFRSHVEKRALVAVVESVQEVSEVKGEPWERRLTVYLVDTSREDRDLWIHNIVTDISSELSSAA